jgi:hypothetical protein
MLLLVMFSLPVLMLITFLRSGWLSDERRITTWARLRTWLRHNRLCRQSSSASSPSDP